MPSPFVTVDPCSDFPLHNLPYGIFSTPANPLPRPGVAIGDCVLDLSLISAAGLFSGPLLSGNSACFGQVRGAGAGAATGPPGRASRQAHPRTCGSVVLLIHCRAP
jgi:hypothetical protein